MNQSRKTPRIETLLIILLTLLAFGLRVWQLDAFPPGWRDDELINSLVISQKVLDGDLAVYYADASGHEALYHALNGVMLGLFGANFLGIRLLSAFVGTITVPLTYQVGKRLFHAHVGLVAAAIVAVSFWSLMYSRFGLRHILLPPLVLAAFYLFWKGMMKKPVSQSALRTQYATFSFLAAGIFMALGFYTYFASRGVPLILVSFCGYLLLVRPQMIKQRWRGILLMFVVSLMLVIPLIMTLQQQPESDARVAELAVPLVEAQVGNYEPLIEFTVTTLNMFHRSGDGEWLYNIPHRPVFGAVGAVFFWFGVLFAVVLALRPFLQRTKSTFRTRFIADDKSDAAAFLIAWWLAGISPGFISVPPASLGHTIMAQPAVFILTALPIWCIENWIERKGQMQMVKAGTAVLALLLIGSIAIRDGVDYFVNWQERGMVRFLYRAYFHDIADYLNETPDITDFGVTGRLAGPWDRLSLSIDTSRDIRPRWYNPERVLLLQPSISFAWYPQDLYSHPEWVVPLEDGWDNGDYRLARVTAVMEEGERTCFANGLCIVTIAYDPDTYQFEVGWAVERPLNLPSMPLISNPPPPGVYAGPRLAVFAQLVDTAGNGLANDDGLWIDPTTLYTDDLFLQQHRFQVPPDSEPAEVIYGLYDPMTSERIFTINGQDHLRLSITEN
jgi:4-amino-4-deoxy-L-arabinose transferase-like glycosyltransferase